jgi:phage host-nuclease inhibitor protein Gam
MEISMTEPQVWAALGILLAFLTATLTIVTRTISVQVGGLRGELHSEIGGLHNEMNVRFEAMHTEMNARFDAVDDKFDARFDRVQDQISTLDRDVQALTARVFRDDLP